MIIFYNKKTGVIQGTIDGRVHDQHMDMWVGDEKENARLIFEWELNENKEWVLNDDQADLILDIEAGKVDLNKCLIDTDERKIVCP